MRIASTPLLTLLLVGSALAPRTAAASGGGAQAVEEGRRLALEARFDDALEAFARAAASTDLEKSDVVALLEGRAMVHHGQRDDDAFQEVARGLASIAPDYEPSRRIPPRLARRLRAAVEGAAPLTLETSGTRSGEGVVVTSQVVGDAGSLVRRVVVTARVGAADYADHEGERVSLPAGPTEGVRYYVRAIGPGGAILASVGDADAPQVMPVEELPPPAVTATATGSDDETSSPRTPAEPFEDTSATDDESGLPIWPFVVGGVLLSGALVAIILALSIEGNDTAPEIPGHPL